VQKNLRPGEWPFARHFKLAVVAAYSTVALIFGGWTLADAVAAAAEHTTTRPVSQIASAAALTGAALGFLLAVADDWRVGIPIHRSRKIFASMLLLVAVPTILVLT